MYGLTAKEAKGQSVLAIIPPRLHAEVTHLLEMVIHGERNKTLKLAELPRMGGVPSPPVRFSDQGLFRKSWAYHP